jgi:protein PET100
MKAEKLARRMEREKGLQAQEEAVAQSSKGWFKWW